MAMAKLTAAGPDGESSMARRMRSNISLSFLKPLTGGPSIVSAQVNTLVTELLPFPVNKP
jgi:hypothetical protein